MKVNPFAAVRPDPQFADKLNAPPYDVVDRHEVEARLKGNPRSFFRITRSDGEMPDVDEHAEVVYQRAKENLAAFLKDKILFREAKPCYYLLSQTWQGRTQTGLYAAVSCEEYLSNKIKKHEFTRKDKEADRTKHIYTTRLGTGPVFLAFDSGAEYAALIGPVLKQPSAYSLTDENGVDNKLYLISDDAHISQIRAYFEKVDALYIADGHHRAASAVNVYRDYGKEIGAGAACFMAVLFPASELRILPYNRAVLDLNGLSDEALLTKISQKFAVEKSDSLDTDRKGLIKMGLKSGIYSLNPKAGTYDASNPLESLDVSILQTNLLGPVLGIDDPRTSSRIKFVGGIKGTAELTRRLKQNEASAVFSLFPVSMAELMAIVNQNDVMPPKSTWFEPKLRDGLVSYPLD